MYTHRFRRHDTSSSHRIRSFPCMSFAYNVSVSDIIENLSINEIGVLALSTLNQSRGVIKVRVAWRLTANHRKSSVGAINYTNLRIPQIVDPPSALFVTISFRFLAHRPSNFGANPRKYLATPSGLGPCLVELE